MDLLVEANRLAAYLAVGLKQTLVEDRSEKRIIAAYSGEFQPFHQGHYEVFQRLQNKFGKDNVYLITGEQDGDDPAEPMSFKDKEEIITEMFGISKDKIQQVENPYIPKELLERFDAQTTAYVAIVDEDAAEQLEKSEYFEHYAEDRPLRGYRQAGYFLSEPEVRIKIGNQNLSDSQLIQILGSKHTKDEVKNRILNKMFPKKNSKIFDLVKKKASLGAKKLDGFEFSDATGQDNKETGFGKTDAKGQDTKTPEVIGSKNTPIMQRKIRNPLTGRAIKIQSALKYPRWKPVYKMANQVLKAAGIDRKDRTDDPEVNQRYRRRAQRMKKEDIANELSQQLTEELLQIARTEGLNLNITGLGEVTLRLENVDADFLFEGGAAKPIVVYPGRFQPFHAGHYSVYKSLVDKYGAENVYIATSNKTDNEKSPFNFDEKQFIMSSMFGIPKDKIVQVKNPYAPEEILNKFPEDTPFITALSEKDAQRLTGGKYYQELPDDPSQIKGDYKNVGYYMIAPEFQLDVDGQNISGTTVRNVLGDPNRSPADKKQMFTSMYGKFDADVFNLVTSKIGEMKARGEADAAAKAKKLPDREAKTAALAQAKLDAQAARDAWQLHSANPVGRKNIERAMRSAERSPGGQREFGKRKPAAPEKSTTPKQPEKKVSAGFDPQILNTTIRNPETDNDILVKTALGYDKTHPAYKAAAQKIRSEAKMILEGGNAVSVNSKIPNQFAQSTTDAVANKLGLGKLDRALVGSTHKPLMNDLDVAMDFDAVKQAIGFSGTDKKEFFTQLKSYLDGMGMEVRVNPGFQQFSVAAPLVDDQGKQQSAVDADGQSTGEGGVVQLDFMMGDLPFMKRFLTNGDKSSLSPTYRNNFIRDILSNLVEDTDTPGVKKRYIINYRNGIYEETFTENAKGKRETVTKEKVSNDVNFLAKIMFGENSSFDEIDTFEKLAKRVIQPDVKFRDKLPAIVDQFKTGITKMKKELPAGIPDTGDAADAVEKSVAPSSDKKVRAGFDPQILNTKIRNPETDNDILVKTALKYDKTHPAYKAAEKVVRNSKK
jgi:nicotinamide mononucleotide adenylyltransferase